MATSIAIQTHRDREEMALDLAGCVGAAEVVLDPEPDHGLRSPWRTYRHALERTPAGAESRLILQDDVLVCDRFAEAVELAVEARPGRVLCFFVAGNPDVHRIAVQGAAARGQTWVEMNLQTWVPVVATLWPVSLIAPFLSWYDGQRETGKMPEAFTADDAIVGRFLIENRIRPLACAPSIVEHPDTVPSLANGHRRGGDGLDVGRRAAVWIGDLGFCDATLIDWTTGAGS